MSAQRTNFTSNIEHALNSGASAADPEGRAANEKLRSVVEDIVANVFGVEAGLLRLATRGRAKVALARQVAMYVAHVGYGLSLTQVGEVFDRDRTTVAHACAVVEQRREDKEFDEAIVLIETITRAINGPFLPRTNRDAEIWPVSAGTV